MVVCILHCLCFVVAVLFCSQLAVVQSRPQTWFVIVIAEIILLMELMSEFEY